MQASILTVGTLKRCTKGLWPRELEQATAIQMPRSTGPSKRAHWNSRPNFDSCPKPLKLTAGFRKWYHKDLYNAVFFCGCFFRSKLAPRKIQCAPRSRNHPEPPNHAVIWAETTRPMLLGNEGLGRAALEKPGGLPAVAEIVAEK